MNRTVFGLVLLLEGLSVMPVHAQDPQGMRRPKLVVTDTLDNVTTLQPTAGLNDGTDDGSAARGKDVSSWAGCGSSITNQGAANACSVDSSTCNSCSGYGFVRFSLASMPTSNIASAQIQLYTGVLHWSCGWPWAEDPVFGLRKVTSDWNEMTLDWNLQPTFDPTAIASYTFSGVAGLSDVAAYRWVSYDITDLYKGWASGTVQNYGVRISHDNPFCMNCDAAFFYSSDDGLTKVTYTGPITGNYGDPATVSAQLVNIADGSVVVGRTLSFTVGTQSCTANTDATGNASCGLTPSGTGTQTITVSFAGDLQYQASTTTAQFQSVSAAQAAGLLVDSVADGSLSDGNGVLEPGETALIEPSWKNVSGGLLSLTGTASSFTGPGGATYTLNDSAATYGSIAPAATSDCGTATGNCYEMTVSNPVTRPATHWDASFTETLSDGDAPTARPLHIGLSFTDVPKSHTFYSFIERILHKGLTTGCTTTAYCPDDTVFRLQMGIFIARAQAGGDANIPVSGSAQGNPYNCVSGGQSQFTDIDPSDAFCRHVHYIFSTGVTTGCVTTPPRQYCPNDNVTRGQMALFIARAVAGTDAAVPQTYGPDPVTGRSYSCSAGSPNLHFIDITTSDIFCRHTHFLWARDVISGFPDGTFGPALFVTRGAMAKFLANGFNLKLYGP